MSNHVKTFVTDDKTPDPTSNRLVLPLGMTFEGVLG